jgi:tRNA 2-selenouridine synthase
MPVHTLPASAVADRLGAFDAIIDARTEAEYAEDHLPGAVNWPTLDNDERILIGTLYKQVNAFEAKKRGAALSARNIAAHIERHVIDQPKGWRPLVYCWRGGNRSGALATILGAIGFQVTLVEGGYKAWRAALLAELPGLSTRLRYRVVCGPTGSGKTRLLQALAAQGEQVLDLEALACHRSSVLGLVPGQPQPSQKGFDSRIWHALRGMDPERVVYVESESKKVGNLRVPDALMEAMRGSPCLDLRLNDQERVALLMEDYAHFLEDTDFFCDRLGTLVTLRGHETIQAWQALVRAGRSDEVVRALLAVHYDPVYAASIQRNFVHYGQALPCPLRDRSASALNELAQAIAQTPAQASTASA